MSQRYLPARYHGDSRWQEAGGALSAAPPAPRRAGLHQEQRCPRRPLHLRRGASQLAPPRAAPVRMQAWGRGPARPEPGLPALSTSSPVKHRSGWSGCRAVPDESPATSSCLHRTAPRAPRHSRQCPRHAQGPEGPVLPLCPAWSRPSRQVPGVCSTRCPRSVGGPCFGETGAGRERPPTPTRTHPHPPTPTHTLHGPQAGWGRAGTVGAQQWEGTPAAARRPERPGPRGPDGSGDVAWAAAPRQPHWEKLWATSSIVGAK